MLLPPLDHAAVVRIVHEEIGRLKTEADAGARRKNVFFALLWAVSSFVVALVWGLGIPSVKSEPLVAVTFGVVSVVWLIVVVVRVVE